jgi:hypothetical protein
MKSLAPCQFEVAWIIKPDRIFYSAGIRAPSKQFIDLTTFLNKILSSRQERSGKRGGGTTIPRWNFHDSAIGSVHS